MISDLIADLIWDGLMSLIPPAVTNAILAALVVTVGVFAAINLVSPGEKEPPRCPIAATAAQPAGEAGPAQRNRSIRDRMDAAARRATCGEPPAGEAGPRAS